MKSLAIYGASSLGLGAAAISKRIEPNVPVYLYDDVRQMSLNGVVPVRGDYSVLVDDVEADFVSHVVIAIGDNRSRESAARRLEARVNSIKYSTLVDVCAVIMDGSSVGHGSIIFPGAVISPSVVLGLHTIVGSNSTIGSAVLGGDFVNVGPNVGLGCQCNIAHGVYIGIGATVNQCLTIGELAVVGASAAVVRNIQARCIYVGNPARPIDAK